MGPRDAAVRQFACVLALSDVEATDRHVPLVGRTMKVWKEMNAATFEVDVQHLHNGSAVT